jgi:hypothetical protein
MGVGVKSRLVADKGRPAIWWRGPTALKAVFGLSQTLSASQRAKLKIAYLVPLPPCHPGTHGTRVAVVVPLSGTTISFVV